MPQFDPFAGTDFAQGGLGGQRGLGDEPIGPKPVPLPSTPPPPSAPAEVKAAFWRSETQRLTNEAPKGGPVTIRDPITGKALYTSEGDSIDPQYKEALDNAQAQAAYWESKAYEEGVTYPRTRADKSADEAAATERSRISAGATLGAAGISAGSSAFSAEEATRRQGAQQEWQTGESGLNRQATTENTILTSRLVGEREQKQREFDAQQKGLDREIQNIQNKIAQGTLDLSTALGVLQKYLDAQPYTLPKGAEYAPGFQPGGAVQEASRLAGVNYTPQRAQTVPFDPAALVRQTMGR